ncbi:MAG: DUF1570 domain-containing protein [Victivallaceae bacterium]|nr:DUF1570 domain-containing protein [Victivallaceae bacterium]
MFRIPVLLAICCVARLAAADSEWWSNASQHYIFVSNQPGRAYLKTVQRELEKAHRCYGIIFPMGNYRSEKGKVRIFATRQEYLDCVGKQYAWSGGLWNPNKNELSISPLDPKFPADIRRRQLHDTLFHEGFHQFVFTALSSRTPSPWFNEGCAQALESMDLEGRYWRIELAPWRINNARKHIGGIQLQKLLDMDYKEFYGSNVDANYSRAHSLMFYLLVGAPAEKRESYSEIPRKYYMAMHNHKDPVTATKLAFTGIDLSTLSKELVAFWSNDDRVAKASDNWTLKK